MCVLIPILTPNEPPTRIAIPLSRLGHTNLPLAIPLPITASIAIASVPIPTIWEWHAPPTHRDAIGSPTTLNHGLTSTGWETRGESIADRFPKHGPTMRTAQMVVGEVFVHQSNG